MERHFVENYARSFLTGALFLALALGGWTADVDAMIWGIDGERWNRLDSFGDYSAGLGWSFASEEVTEGWTFGPDARVRGAVPAALTSGGVLALVSGLRDEFAVVEGRDLVTGRRLWQTQFNLGVSLGSEEILMLHAPGEDLFAYAWGRRDELTIGELTRIDPASGEVLWQTEVLSSEQHVLLIPQFSAENAWMYYPENGQVTAFDLRDGTARVVDQLNDVRGFTEDGKILGSEDLVIALGASGAAIAYGSDARAGRLWEREAGSTSSPSVPQFAQISEGMFFFQGFREIVALDLGNGAEIWSREVPGVGLGISGRRLYTLDAANARLYELSAATGEPHSIAAVLPEPADSFVTSSYPLGLDALFHNSNQGVVIRALDGMQVFGVLPPGELHCAGFGHLVTADMDTVSVVRGRSFPEIALWPEKMFVGDSARGSLPPGAVGALVDEGATALVVGDGEWVLEAPGAPGELVIALRFLFGNGESLPVRSRIAIVSREPSVRLLGSRAVVAGSALRLEARAEGRTPMEFRWFRDGEELGTSNEGRWEIGDVDRAAAGNYRVEASNAHGRAESNVLEVTVLNPDDSALFHTHLRGNVQRTGFVPVDTNPERIADLWSGGDVPPGALAILAEGHLFSAQDDLILARDPRTGSEVWRYRAQEGAMFRNLTYDDGRLYARVSADVENWLLALEASSGALLWMSFLDRDRGFWSEPLAADGKVVAAGSPNLEELHVYNGEDGRLLLGARGLVEYQPLAYADGDLFGVWQGKLRRIDLDSGRIVWRSARSILEGTVPLLGPDVVFIESPQGLAALDLATGRERWLAAMPGAAGGLPALTYDGRHLFEAWREVIRKLDPESGVVLQSATSRSAPLFATGDFYSSAAQLFVESGGLVSVWDSETLDYAGVLPITRVAALNGGYLVGYSRVFDLNAAEPSIAVEIAGETTVLENDAFDLTVSARSQPGETLRLRFYQAPPQGMSIRETGSGEWKVEGPVLGGPQERTLSLIVESADGHAVLKHIEFTILPVNDPPAVIQPFELISVNEGQDLSRVRIDDRFRDEEDGALAFTVARIDPPQALAARIETGYYQRWIHVELHEDFFGEARIVLRASDFDGASVEHSVVLAVQPLPDPPRPVSLNRPLLAPEDGSRHLVPFDGLFVDPDGDPLEWRVDVPADSRLVSSVETGDEGLTVHYHPYLAGVESIGVGVRDPTGFDASRTLQVEMPAFPLPAIERGGVRFNPQTGLYEEVVIVRNASQRAVGGFELTMQGLAEGGPDLYYAHAKSESGPLVRYPHALAGGAALELLLEWHSPEREAPGDWEPEVKLLLPARLEASGEPAMRVERIVMLDDGAVLLEFASEAGESYEVEYSDDGDLWEGIPFGIKGAGSRTFWIDRGPPHTSVHPRDAGSRLYRFRKATE